MRVILGTNDDGVQSEGIETLAAALKPVGDVIVVEPVVRMAAGPSDDDEASLAQKPKLLRGRARRQPR